MPGSRTQKKLSDEEISQIASVYQAFRRTGAPDAKAGFCRATTIDEVRGQLYALTPGRYVGSAEVEGNDEPLDEIFPRLVAELEGQFSKSEQLMIAIREQLAQVRVDEGTE